MGRVGEEKTRDAGARKKTRVSFASPSRRLSPCVTKRGLSSSSVTCPENSRYRTESVRRFSVPSIFNASDAVDARGFGGSNNSAATRLPRVASQVFPPVRKLLARYGHSFQKLPGTHRFFVRRGNEGVPRPLESERLRGAR